MLPIPLGSGRPEIAVFLINIMVESMTVVTVRSIDSSSLGQYYVNS